VAFGHVVIAVDGSPAADEATRVGLEIAAGVGAEVTFVHCDRVLAEQVFEEDSRATESVERRLEVDPVLRTAAAAAAARGVSAGFELVSAEGSKELVPAILGIASAVGADFVVVGSRGRGPLASVVLGSVSQGILEAAGVPVVVVHSPHQA
jgi:nucleotide-binding universal stress UspA family protein